MNGRIAKTYDDVKNIRWITRIIGIIIFLILIGMVVVHLRNIF